MRISMKFFFYFFLFFSLILVSLIQIIFFIDFNAFDSTMTSFGLPNQKISYKTENITNNKFVIITFGDISKSQYTNAKPILDKYGFKASFFVTCNWVGNNLSSEPRMTWDQIQQLYHEGHDVESKTMSHPDLNKIKSISGLEYEIGNSKKCLQDHNISNVTIFAPPHGNVHNSTIINIISKYYDFADNGFGNLMFLHCNDNQSQYKNKYYMTMDSPKQKDCRTYDDNGLLTNTNRYSIKEWSHNYLDSKFNHNNTEIFNDFINEINSQKKYNMNDVLAIPIIAYHKIDNSKDSSSTNVALFESEIKYLHDNGFKVIKMSQLGYDEKNNVFYILNNISRY